MTNDSNVYDLTISNSHRYKLLSDLDISLQFETIKRLMDIYRLSGVKKLEKFFSYICIFDTRINLYLKQEMLCILIAKINPKNKLIVQKAFSSIIYLILQKAFDNAEYWLMLKEMLGVGKPQLCDIGSDLVKNIILVGFKRWKREEDPFKKLFALVNIFKDEHFFVPLCIFIYHRYKAVLNTKDKLLLLQIVFESGSEQKNAFADDLFLLALNPAIDLNQRLEACDILYLKGDENVRSRVESVLNSVLPDLAYTQNPENVHMSSIKASVDRTLEALLDFNKGKKAPQDLHTKLLDIFKTSPAFSKIRGSLNRVFNYTFLKFSKYKLTLKEIMENVCMFIDSCDIELREQLRVRLEQELVDMYDTCSQGYVTRLINVFSGFEIGFGIMVSYEDEIYAIFSSKVNKVVECAPEPIRTQLLEELMVPSDDHCNRLNLIRYLRPHLSKIWNEIFEIFKEELTVTDLDLYSRKVTMKYEGC